MRGDEGVAAFGRSSNLNLLLPDSQHRYLLRIHVPWHTVTPYKSSFQNGRDVTDKLTYCGQAASKRRVVGNHRTTVAEGDTEVEGVQAE